jgi:ABC-type dipeptide/oligopeptide/nickel transport system ATPase subunit
VSELEFRRLTVAYGHGSRAQVAVDQVDLTVRPGTTHGLVGESGSGKSTLARAAVGLAPVASGQILLGGVDVTGPSRYAGAPGAASRWCSRTR